MHHSSSLFIFDPLLGWITGHLRSFFDVYTLWDLESKVLKYVLLELHLHEQVFLDNFAARSLFAHVDWGRLRKNYIFLLDKCTCSKDGVPVF